MYELVNDKPTTQLDQSIDIKKNIEYNFQSDSKQIYNSISLDNKMLINFFHKMFPRIQEKYLKYFVMLFLHISSIILFALIYYLMMLDFDTYYFIPKDFEPEHFKRFPLIIALFMSINFQTTTAYVDLKMRSIIARCFVMLQLCMSFIITFLVLFEK
jgi:hypothetical protein